jgi:hypothetical protein
MPEQVPCGPLLIIDTDGWVSVFRSQAEAEGYLEALDVEADEYTGVDSVGQRLTFSVDTSGRESLRWWQRLRYQDSVRITVALDQPADPDGLLHVLQQVLPVEAKSHRAISELMTLAARKTGIEDLRLPHD